MSSKESQANAGFAGFQKRLAVLRAKALAFADRDELNKSLDLVEKLWVDAAKAANLMECKQVASAVAETQRFADTLAWNVLNCDTSKTNGQQLMDSIVKYQALERMRSAFEPVAALAFEEAVAAGLETEPQKDDQA